MIETGQSRIDFIIPGPFVAKARPRTKTIIEADPFGRLTQRTWGYTPERSRNYAGKAALLVKSLRAQQGFQTIPYPAPVSLAATFVLRRQATARPDLANLYAQLCDILTVAGIYTDDSQVVESDIKKEYGKVPMTRVEVKAL